MKRHLTILATALLFCFTVLPAFGQQVEQLEAHVPFPFLVENTTLPAGNYLIDTVGPTDSVLLIRNEDKGTSVEFLTESIETRANKAVETPSLVFEVANGQHFLSEVWANGTNRGWKLFPSRVEKRAMKDGGDHMLRTSVNCTKTHKG